ncbi:diaminopimelate decarboxylase [candidate division WOR-3 bacterium]|uniref:Diaminopimelate decarboxylase n=1 Tax=candidate division WOR-3 bacterium TaxID=2052148 RepID=A0A9D5KAN2_UNCW3|nr:diaminopimelate decarboxylase [candidate division WOR-3 bacterium]MBD3365613.1 diaminopimelate decarboxylase [candidate division WOR-3 bacterium]
MHSFQRRGKELFCEDKSLTSIAEEYGTPLYVYSHSTVTRHYQVFEEAFASIPHIICYAVKANPTGAILKLLAKMDSGADIVSGGELYRALRAGIEPSRIVYSGVGKTEKEMEDALQSDILMFNIESFTELAALDEVAGRMGKRARISLRINPDIDPGTHPYVATGLRTSKFGIPFEYALEGYDRAAKLPNIDIIGVDCHIGSQLTELSPFVDAVKKLIELITVLRQKDNDIQYLDIGGGLGIPYNTENPPSPAEFADAVKRHLAEANVTLILEPGRSIVGNAGILLTRVLYTKKGKDRRFVIVDAGMNDLLRPSLYDAYHEIAHVVDEERDIEVSDIVGPICESGDFLAKDRRLPRFDKGDLIAVMSAGAYGASMSSTYNSRPLAAEVLVNGQTARLIRKRGSCEDLIRGERVT